mgnify:CR=1 FL=1
MIVFLQFKNLGNYEMGPKLSNVWNDSQPPGPKFANADWHTNHDDDTQNVGADGTYPTYTPVGHRTETIDLNLPIKKQLRRINGTPVILLLFPIYIHAIKDDANTLHKLIKTFEPFPQVNFMFSNTWDLGHYEHAGFNAVDYILDSVKDIDNERLNFYLCNKYVVDAIKTKRPDVDAKFMAFYFNRIKQFNREQIEHHSNQRTKHFLCLNNLEKKHRTFIVDRMPPDSSYVSYLGKDIKLQQDITLSQTDIAIWQDSLPQNYYNDSYINIVNETMHGYDVRSVIELDGERLSMQGHVTEKSFKPVYFRQLFLISGIAGANKLMQDLGFKLFDNFINYSFDSEPDPLLRLKKLYVEIKRLTDIDIADIHSYYNSTECQSIIDHNLAVYGTHCFIPTQELITKYNTVVNDTPEFSL